MMIIPLVLALLAMTGLALRSFDDDEDDACPVCANWCCTCKGFAPTAA